MSHKHTWRPRDPETGRFLSREYCRAVMQEVGDSVTTFTAVELGVLAPDWFEPSAEEVAHKGASGAPGWDSSRPRNACPRPSLARLKAVWPKSCVC
jgi:hypothetical protein